MADRRRMHIVVAGHVDHGKSTLVGRLLADTGSLPQGKIEAIRALCCSRARPFEYAFLLDALKEEQAQGITIDSSRSFFSTARRDYLFIDAPGHPEFLKNMVSGATRADAAILLIDSAEGIRDNSRCHAHLLAMVGITQLIVCINKMDCTGFSQSVFSSLQSATDALCRDLGIGRPVCIPVCARDGDNIAVRSSRMDWYGGKTVLEEMEALADPADDAGAPLRFPVQDIYKFTQEGDTRRIIAGTVESGAVSPGDAVIFLPSGKRSTIATIERFNGPTLRAATDGMATGFTLTDSLFISRGQVMCHTQRPTRIGKRVKTSLFWMDHDPMTTGKRYTLRLATQKIAVELREILSIVQASEIMPAAPGKRLERHAIGVVVLETAGPFAFDLFGENRPMARFVILDSHRVAGGGIITAQVESDPELACSDTQRFSSVNTEVRKRIFGHGAAVVVLCGPESDQCALSLEAALVASHRMAFYFGRLEGGAMVSRSHEVAASGNETESMHLAVIRSLTEAGLIVILSTEKPPSENQPPITGADAAYLLVNIDELDQNGGTTCVSTTDRLQTILRQRAILR